MSFKEILKQGRALEAAILAVGLIATGAIVCCGLVRVKEMDHIVSVKGLAEREVKADKVVWPLIYKEIGNDPSAMYTQLEQKNRQVVEFLKSGGITEAEISINPPTVSDRQADNYSGDAVSFRYKATSVITVTSKNVEKVRALMLRQPELMKQGIAIVGADYGENTVTYDFTQLNDIKPALIEEATKNARAAAQKFADDSESELGGICSASQGYVSIENRDQNTPHIKTVRVVTTVDYLLK